MTVITGNRVFPVTFCGVLRIRYYLTISSQVYIKRDTHPLPWQPLLSASSAPPARASKKTFYLSTKRGIRMLRVPACAAADGKEASSHKTVQDRTWCPLPHACFPHSTPEGGPSLRRQGESTGPRAARPRHRQGG